ncbi:167_t:CDS:2, partial [Scutellospora calospora]
MNYSDGEECSDWVIASIESELGRIKIRSKFTGINGYWVELGRINIRHMEENSGLIIMT